ncbi:MAG: glycosyltransferase [Raineya sp.]|jgi:glycosyltransferase involved in cell wall biosynthesis|nr:glycosyltransferase [Raineya sp.]
MFFSLIIPVYNRPDELDELLESLTKQVFDTAKIRFEVVVIEDGSKNKADQVAKKYKNQFDLTYFYKENAGQGFARNTGFEIAKGDYLVVFDSDALVPPHYLQTVYDFLEKTPLDAFGGADKAHESFTDTQKAISYAMTSLFSTGGIRGNTKSAEKFRPRSFNMGISRAVYEKTKGYKITRMGEDIEFSIRIEDNGFKIGFIPNAYVYHKRRTSFKQFYKQLHFFGRGRINIWRFFPKELKLVHCFPAAFVLYTLASPVGFLIHPFLGLLMTGSLAFYFMVIWIDALIQTKSLKVSLMSVGAVCVQLTAYGIGFMTEAWKEIWKKK